MNHSFPFNLKPSLRLLRPSGHWIAMTVIVASLFAGTVTSFAQTRQGSENPGTAPIATETTSEEKFLPDDFPAEDSPSPPPGTAPVTNRLPSPSATETTSNSSAPQGKESGKNSLLSAFGLPSGGWSQWTAGEGILSGTKIAILLTVLSLVPAILMMTTCYVRIVTVLAILRQGLGTGQIPSTQILAAISLFLTILVMTPTWTKVYEDALLPYSQGEIDATTAFDRGQLPIRTFLWKQIEKTRNTESIWLFMRYIPDAEKPEYYEDIPWRALLPAYMLSELKTAFLIGFQLFLPFLIIDLVVSAVMVSMGMMMLPPTIVSLPFKLMLFVLMDGWTLVVKMLLDSVTVLT